MNEFNIKFVQDMNDRLKEVRIINEKIYNVYRMKEDVCGATRDIVHFVNKNVMATATTSLYKTDTILPYSENERDEYNKKNFDEYITFNQKGIGTIRVKKPEATVNYTYGTHISEEYALFNTLTTIGG